MTAYSKNIGRTTAAALMAAALLAACTQDEALTGTTTGAGPELALPSEANGIVISSGAGAGATRVPQIDSVCRADAIDVMVFKDGRRSSSLYEDGGWPKSASDLDVCDIFNPDVKIIGNDRYAQCTVNVKAAESGGTNHYTYAQSTALAYNSTEKALFTTNPVNRTEISLTINNSDGKYKTPELSYGAVMGKGATSDDDVKTSGGTGGRPGWFNSYFSIYWNWNENMGDKRSDRDITFYGRIYRIVSQLNLNITDLPPMAVERIELYGDNYPTAMNLYGSHGTYYPVSAASATTEKYTEPTDEEQKKQWAESGKFVLLDSTTVAQDQTVARLSTFLLPSEAGMSLRLRVYYRPATEQAVQSDEREYKDYKLSPTRSYRLTGDDAAVYTGATDAVKDNDNGGLFVYNQLKDEFYSYANVRVNMSGKFENFAAETSQADITIEVIPGFEPGPHSHDTGAGVVGGFNEVHEIPLN